MSSFEKHGLQSLESQHAFSQTRDAVETRPLLPGHGQRRWGPATCLTCEGTWSHFTRPDFCALPRTLTPSPEGHPLCDLYHLGPISNRDKHLHPFTQRRLICGSHRVLSPGAHRNQPGPLETPTLTPHSRPTTSEHLMVGPLHQ